MYIHKDVVLQACICINIRCMESGEWGRQGFDCWSLGHKAFIPHARISYYCNFPCNHHHCKFCLPWWRSKHAVHKWTSGNFAQISKFPQKQQKLKKNIISIIILCGISLQRFTFTIMFLFHKIKFLLLKIWNNIWNYFYSYFHTILLCKVSRLVTSLVYCAIKI